MFCFQDGTFLITTCDLSSIFDSFPNEGISSDGKQRYHHHDQNESIISIPTFFVNGTKKNFWLHLFIMAKSLHLYQQEKLPLLLPIEPQIEAYLDMLKRLDEASFDFTKIIKNSNFAQSNEEPDIRHGIYLKQQFFHSAYPMIFEDELKITKNVGSGTYSDCWKCTLKSPIINISSCMNHSKIVKRDFVYKKLKPIMQGNQRHLPEDLTEGNAAVVFQGIKRLLKPIALIIRVSRSADSKSKDLIKRGYLFEWAEFGDLSMFLHSTIVPLDCYFIQNIMTLADSLHQVHSRGFIHRDVRVENVFVRKGSADKPYKFVLGDFGLCCRTGPQGNCDVLSPFNGWERTRIYPREIFDKKLSFKLSPATDWFEFGTFLRSIANHWSERESHWISLTSPLITTLTRKNMSSGDRWGYQEVKKYLEMLLQHQHNHQEFLPSFVFTFAFVVCPAQRKDEIYHFRMNDSPKIHSVSFGVLYDYSVCFKGGFLPMTLEEGEISFLHWKKEGQEQERCIFLQAPQIYKFIKSFPFPITSDVTHMEKRLFSVGDYLVMQSNLHFFCFCEEFCLLHSFLQQQECLENVETSKVIEAINSFPQGPYVIRI